MKQFWNGGYVNTLRFFVSIFVQAFPMAAMWDIFSISLIILSRNYGMKT